MNWDRIEGDWKPFRGHARQQWGDLTNDDLGMVEGRQGEIVCPRPPLTDRKEAAIEHGPYHHSDFDFDWRRPYLAL